ncbi:LexA family protein [Faecalibaculum rodentium]|uniref:LexA family protein n=1 Tax=Faecalibaculum rodentium TaxID=1702221 RepID=UPI002574D584|nr:S24 family peptidase [Faecalibaculum rodentium]
MHLEDLRQVEVVVLPALEHQPVRQAVHRFRDPSQHGIQKTDLGICCQGAVACEEPIYMDEVRGEYYPMDSSIHADFCLRAQGDSMTGARIYDGDIIFIQSSPVVENGQIAAVAVDDEATLKYFYQYGDTVVLRPANAKYGEMTYSREDLDHLRILGRAVAFQSGL